MDASVNMSVNMSVNAGAGTHAHLDERQADSPPASVGSLEHALLALETEEERESGDPPPKFSLDLLPPFLRTGSGAAQVTELYSQFNNSALTVAALDQKLPTFGLERIGLLLDNLVDRRLLVPFQLGGELYWKPSS